jgi:hypothetical protein
MKKIFFALLAITVTSAAFAQPEYERPSHRQDDETEQQNGFKKQNLFLGGNFGLGVGSYTNINISPQIGYHLSPMFDAGVGINFQYISQKTYDYNGNDFSKITQFVTGGNIFGRFYPFPQGFIQVQPEYNVVSYKETFYNGSYEPDKFSKGVPSLLVGAGARLNGLLIGVFYDAAQDVNSPYGGHAFLSFGYNIPLH